MRLASPLVSRARSLALAGAVVLAPLALTAQAGAPASSLPPARQLIDKHIAAVGGRQALLAHKNARLKGSFEVPAQGMQGEFEMLSANPNLMAMKVTIPGIGDITSGYDGKTAWTNNPMQGPRIMSGKELDALKEAGPEAELRDASLLTSAETVEKTTMGGQACYKVKLVWKSGRTTYDCYSVDSGLRVGQQMSQESPMGTVEVQTTLSDYTDFGGVKRAAKSTQEMMGMQQVMTIKSIEYDVVPPTAFELPKEIKALVDKK